MAASLASADADRTLNNRRRPAPVLIPSSPLPPLVAVQMQQTVPSRERKGAWSKLGKVFGVVVPKRYASARGSTGSIVQHLYEVASITATAMPCRTCDVLLLIALCCAGGGRPISRKRPRCTPKP